MCHAATLLVNRLRSAAAAPFSYSRSLLLGPRTGEALAVELELPVHAEHELAGHADLYAQPRMLLAKPRTRREESTSPAVPVVSISTPCRIH
jgi:hypothetical protein